MSIGITDILQIADALCVGTQRVGRLCNEAAALEAGALRVSSTPRLLASPAHAALVHGRDNALNRSSSNSVRRFSWLASPPD